MQFHPELVKLKRLFNMAGVRVSSFILPTLLAAASALFEGTGVALLIPFIKGVIERDFSFIREASMLEPLVGMFPQVFENNLYTSIFLITLMVASILLKNILYYLSITSFSRKIRGFTNKLRKLIFKKYMSSGKLFFDRNNQGYLSNVLMDSTNIIANQLTYLKYPIIWLPLLCVYLTVMLLILWKLTLLTLILLPLLYYLLKPILVRIKEASKDYADSRARLSRKAFNTLSCMPLVKSYTWENEEKKQFASLSDHVGRMEYSLDAKYGVMLPLQEIIVVIAILCLGLLIGPSLTAGGSGEVSRFLVYLFILKRASNSLSCFNNIKASLAMMSGQMDEVYRILDDKDNYPVTGGSKEFGGLMDAIEFNHLSFSYASGQPMLKDVSFSVERGSVTAIVGPTGSGKTTISSLLMRFYDCPPAAIMLDGVDIREFNIESLRSHMALVGQDTLLFNDTIRNNITYGLTRDITDDELTNVLEKARLRKFINQLPAGLDTPIGDMGVKLSGGEKQRLAIARALLKNASILILDEATSSLDSKTEKLVQEAIEEAIRGKTAIVIAHRLSTIKNADKIVVLDDGVIVEDGPLRKLLKEGGRFQRYWEAQKFE